MAEEKKTKTEEVLDELNEQLEKLEDEKSFFVTITTKKGDNLSHYWAGIGFPNDDKIPSLEHIVAQLGMFRETRPRKKIHIVKPRRHKT